MGEVSVPRWDRADRMRKALRHAGIGVQEMADYLGVSRGAVGTWINGRVNPPAPSLRLFAQRCGVPYEWLDTGAESGFREDDPTERKLWAALSEIRGLTVEQKEFLVRDVRVLRRRRETSGQDKPDEEPARARQPA